MIKKNCPYFDYKTKQWIQPPETISITIPMVPAFDQFEDKIKREAGNSDLSLEIYYDKIIIHGFPESVYQLHQTILKESNLIMNRRQQPNSNGYYKSHTIYNVGDFKLLAKKKSEELDLHYNFDGSDMIIQGSEQKHSKIKELEQYVLGLKDAKYYNQNKSNEKDFCETVLSIPSTFASLAEEEIIENSQKHHVMTEITPNRMQISILGKQSDSFNFLKWLYSNSLVYSMQENFNQEKAIDWRQVDLPFSAFLRKKKANIVDKLKELSLDRQFYWDTLTVEGPLSIIQELKMFLNNIEMTAKKALYPKYWNFKDKNQLSEIQVQQNSEEYQFVLGEFNKTMSNFNIVKITRIQNNHLIEQFINTVVKKQELKPDVENGRKLLFHGTKNLDPQKIYKNFEVGFDLHASNPQGHYGKGVYFTTTASDSHNNCYNIGNGMYQLLLADVFIGRPFQSQPNNALVKAPDGHDSIVDNNNSLYVLYNDFRSYPLYVIDYQNKP